MAHRLDAPDLAALATIACGTARYRRGDVGGADALARGIAEAVAASAHVFAMMGYVLLVEDLWNAGRFADAASWIAAASAHAQDRDLGLYQGHLAAYGFRLQSVHGAWETAEAGLRGLVGSAETGATRYSLPELARLLVRQGADDAEAAVAQALAYARRSDGRYELVPALMARIEQAWLAGRPADAREAVELLTARLAVPGADWARADLLRWRRRLGHPVELWKGCPPEHAAGLRGDWRATAQAFADRGICRAAPSPPPAPTPPA